MMALPLEDCQVVRQQRPLLHLLVLLQLLALAGSARSGLQQWQGRQVQHLAAQPW
jgi:hypothetical protein